MPMRRSLPAALSLLAAALVAARSAHAQIAEAVAGQPSAEPPSLAIVLEAGADRPEFAAQRAETRLQNVAEVVRQLGTQVTRSDTTAFGVTRTSDVEGLGTYPRPAYVARYVVRVRLPAAATPTDVMSVSAALSRAGAASVYLTNPRPAR
ncbi:hypothetical protein J421_0245 [Gemmatirosa kalamazoonensis]|uniref:DUF541 domain-containing protein n=1 Tax=Gemmatirosa kalamazoonensis TaxID=861299 RepID=W0RBF6_9BACT|nr:hypothetical protein [Gemmatirosa kalamazoonensis]AHG87782.1 hypothetical protein J421_0245 [Gemmatirosa kalamazoonensis]